MAAAAQEQLITRLARKISDHVEDITLIEEQDMDDAEVVIVAYGISARTAHWPMMQARQEGIRVGLLKLVSVWPFPEARLRDLARRVRAFVVPELNLGQIAREVERCAGGQARTIWVTHPGGDVHPPERVLQAIREAAES
jgi:2-oxoglutarate ferredoxin oxidoreductase subunit alpha